MTGLVIITFIIGYALIAMEHVTKVNKSGVALLMSVVCWGLCSVNTDSAVLYDGFTRNVYETCETILFLIGAMTIVAVIDSSNGFNFVGGWLKSRNVKVLLWKTVGLTFIMSALLDNMTTAIVMIMVLRRIIANRRQMLLFASSVIIAANAGGAFSPIGDVTTIMLWIKGVVTTEGIISGTILPSAVSIVIPSLFMSAMLCRGGAPQYIETDCSHEPFTFPKICRIVIFFIGVGGLILVPVFRSITGLPPFIFVMGVLGVLWIITEVMIHYDIQMPEESQDESCVSNIIRTIDMPTILFFIGILLTVGALGETGALQALGEWLRDEIHNVYVINTLIGILSSIIDNVPLVASAMEMYQIEPSTVVGELSNYSQDGAFWQLLAYCAGTGGSILIIGSAAGVVVMGMEKITFSWYLKHISWLALIGYLAGIATYALMDL